MASIVIKIDNKDIKFRTTAALPRLYRIYFHRDMLEDLNRLAKAQTDNKESGKEFESIDLEIFENLAYIMAKHADMTIPNIDEWYEQFETFSIYEVLEQILSLWQLSAETTVESKKKLNQLTAK